MSALERQLNSLIQSNSDFSIRFRFSQLRRYLTYSYAQFWFWGQDLAHHKHQTFTAYGFKRYPPPAGVGGKSMYLLSLPREQFLCLWAYGLLIGERGKQAVFVRRGSFKLQITKEPFFDLPGEHLTLESLHLSPVKYNAAAVRLWWRYQPELIAAVLGYETWIFSQMSSDYRQLCLKRWRHNKLELTTVVPTLMSLRTLGRSENVKTSGT